jgi:hypothetical protein
VISTCSPQLFASPATGETPQVVIVRTSLSEVKIFRGTKAVDLAFATPFSIPGYGPDQATVQRARRVHPLKALK